MKNKKILVTGGLGYIGSHTVVELLNEDFDVVIVDDLSNSEYEVLNRIKRITGKKPEFKKFNLLNKKKLSSLFKKHKDIDAIIHFAAFKSVGESVEQPRKYYDNNLNSLMNVLEGMESIPSRNIVFSSSCTVYGQPDKLPVTEDAPLKPAESPYGNSKKICEDILLDTSQAINDFKVISLRYFNPVGAHSSSLIGELPKGVPNNLVPFITQTGAGIHSELKIFGDNYDTPDGTAIRDYIHVVDLAHAHIAAIKRMLNGETEKNFEHYNVGAGSGYSVMEIVKCFERVSNQKLNYKIVERRKGDIEKIYAQTNYANEKLNWKATRNLEDMISSAWNWQQSLIN